MGEKITLQIILDIIFILLLPIPILYSIHNLVKIIKNQKLSKKVIVLLYVIVIIITVLINQSMRISENRKDNKTKNCKSLEEKNNKSDSIEIRSKNINLNKKEVNNELKEELSNKIKNDAELKQKKIVSMNSYSRGTITTEHVISPTIRDTLRTKVYPNYSNMLTDTCREVSMSTKADTFINDSKSNIKNKNRLDSIYRILNRKGYSTIKIAKILKINKNIYILVNRDEIENYANEIRFTILHYSKENNIYDITGYAYYDEKKYKDVMHNTKYYVPLIVIRGNKKQEVNENDILLYEKRNYSE